MERSKTTKKVVLMAVSLGTGGMILTSLFGVLDLVKSPAPTPIKAPASSQNAQVEAQENGYLAVLKKEPKNTTAIGGMEKVVQYYMQTGNESKIVASLEKLIAAAPQAERVKEYKKFLDTIKKAPSPVKKEK